MARQVENFEESFLEDVKYVMSLIRLELQSKLNTQGYGEGRGNLSEKKLALDLTPEKSPGSLNPSRLQQSMEFEVQKISQYIVASMYMEDYYIFVEEKTPASRIPFGKKTGKKVSKYIQALWKYWRVKRGLSPEEALRASFATANKHKREGRPTRNSFKYSKDGTRTGFIKDTLKKVEEDVFNILERSVGDRIELQLTAILQTFADSTDLATLK